MGILFVVTDDLARRVVIHAALADAHHLEMINLLGMYLAPSELAQRLRVGSNLLAHHVAILEQAGIVERQPSSGDRRRRYLRLVPQVVAGPSADTEPVIAGAVLFVCVHNGPVPDGRRPPRTGMLTSKLIVRSAGTAPAERSTRSSIHAMR